MKDREQIEELIGRFIASYREGDLEGILAYYADDLIKDRQGAAAESKSETGKRVAAVFRDYATDLDVRNDEIVASGDLAYVRGVLRVTLTPRAGGPPQSFERRFLEIWRRSGGRWLVARTMDNTGPSV